MTTQTYYSIHTDVKFNALELIETMPVLNHAFEPTAASGLRPLAVPGASRLGGGSTQTLGTTIRARAESIRANGSSCEAR